MHIHLLMSLFLMALSGCSHLKPVTSQVPASQLVDKQITRSMSSLSLAQNRLHQTSAARSSRAVSLPTLRSSERLPPAKLTSVRPVPGAGD